MLKFIAYKTFNFFLKKDPSQALTRTTSFLVLFEISFIVPIFIIFNIITGLHPNSNHQLDSRIKYLIAIVLAAIIFLINKRFLKIHLSSPGLEKLRSKYLEKGDSINIWFIFLLPVFNVFIIPIIYGLLNGTLTFPILE